MDWRQEVRQYIDPSIAVLDPCRDKKVGDLKHNGFDCDGVLAGGGFVYRDLHDIRNADAVLLHWWGDPGRQSIGTFMELGYAHSMQIPIIVSDPTGLIKAHPFLHRLAAFIAAPQPTTTLCTKYIGKTRQEYIDILTEECLRGAFRTDVEIVGRIRSGPSELAQACRYVNLLLRS